MIKATSVSIFSTAKNKQCHIDRSLRQYMDLMTIDRIELHKTTKL